MSHELLVQMAYCDTSRSESQTQVKIPNLLSRHFFFKILMTNNKYSFVKKNEQWNPIRGPYVIPTEHNFNWTNIMKELF